MQLAPRVDRLVPMIHVSDVARSIRFYGEFGFDVMRGFTPSGRDDPTWAWLQSGEAALVLIFATTSIVPERHGTVFCLYCHQVKAFHVWLAERGIPVDDIEYAPDQPMGRFRVIDPDGYALTVMST
jgi:catechol 2,3-dioxygenase-like lactoylglutathione lyase family enzyme